MAILLDESSVLVEPIDEPEVWIINSSGKKIDEKYFFKSIKRNAGRDLVASISLEKSSNLTSLRMLFDVFPSVRELKLYSNAIGSLEDLRFWCTSQYSI